MNNEGLNAAVQVLVDRLHTTEDDELQAALWQTLEYSRDIEDKLAALRIVMNV